VRTGILGGTFDPVHIAHLHAGETALRRLGLDRVVLMPAGSPWRKAGMPVSSAADRLEMTRLAVEGVPGFEVDDREVRRAGPTYTVDTLRSFPAEEDLVLILGADAALGLPAWKDPDDVLALAAIAVAPRPGADLAEAAALLPDAVLLDMAMLDVSGAAIREMAGAGRPFRFLTTAAVHAHIEAKGLYTEGANRLGEVTETEESS